jgi:hypothetical protein
LISLTFDTDRMSERALATFLEDVDLPGSATFFCTQVYECLQGTRHECCPHVFLTPETDHTEALERARVAFPDATGWRSHSCVFSHILAEQLARTGYEYVSIHDEMGRTDLAAHRHAWGLWHLPIYYMDNLDFSTSRFWGEDAPAAFAPSYVENAVGGDGLFVFAFHPIHLMLNSPTAEIYFERRDRFEAGAPPEEVRYEGYGTRSFYDDLCAAMRANGLPSVRLDEALAAYRGPAPRARAV